MNAATVRKGYNIIAYENGFVDLNHIINDTKLMFGEEGNHA